MLIVEFWLLYPILSLSSINRQNFAKIGKIKNIVHLLLIEMARTIKVTTKKAVEERAREAGDKKLKLKKMREENEKRAERIRGQKEKQIEMIKEEKREKKRKVWRGIQALKEIQRYQKGMELLIR